LCVDARCVFWDAPVAPAPVEEAREDNLLAVAAAAWHPSPNPPGAGADVQGQIWPQAAQSAPKGWRGQWSASKGGAVDFDGRLSSAPGSLSPLSDLSLSHIFLPLL
jgi:hypothetical protein